MQLLTIKSSGAAYGVHLFIYISIDAAGKVLIRFKSGNIVSSVSTHPLVCLGSSRPICDISDWSRLGKCGEGATRYHQQRVERTKDWLDFRSNFGIIFFTLSKLQ